MLVDVGGKGDEESTACGLERGFQAHPLQMAGLDCWQHAVGLLL